MPAERFGGIFINRYSSSWATQQETRRGSSNGYCPYCWVATLGVLVGMIGGLLLRPAGPDASLLVQAGDAYEVMGKGEETRQILDQLLEQGIGDADILVRIGEVYQAAKEYGSAIEVLEQAVSKDQSNEKTRLALARGYGKAGRFEDAILEYERLIAMDPDNVNYHLEWLHSLGPG